MKTWLEGVPFKAEEVEYGMKNNDVDWNAVAKAWAKQALGKGTWSYSTLGNSMVMDENFENDDVNDAIDAITDSEWTDEAIEYAKANYIGQHFKTLVEEIQSVGFDINQANTAANSVGDFYQNALDAATTYLSINPSAGYYEVFDFLSDNEAGCGYSDDQSVYAADNAKDWYNAALNEANGVYFSYARMIDYLMYGFGFTYDQAVYAAEQQNYQNNANQKAHDYYNANGPCGFLDIAVYLVDDELFSEIQAMNGALSCGEQIEDDPRYYQGDMYLSANPGATQDEVRAYLKDYLGYTDTMINIIIIALFAAG